MNLARFALLFFFSQSRLCDQNNVGHGHINRQSSRPEDHLTPPTWDPDGTFPCRTGMWEGCNIFMFKLSTGNHRENPSSRVRNYPVDSKPASLLVTPLIISGSKGPANVRDTGSGTYKSRRTRLTVPHELQHKAEDQDVSSVMSFGHLFRHSSFKRSPRNLNIHLSIEKPIHRHRGHLDNTPLWTTWGVATP